MTPSGRNVSWLAQDGMTERRRQPVLKVSEPFKTEIEDQSLLPSSRRGFTVFTHAPGGSGWGSATFFKGSQSHTLKLWSQRLIFGSCFCRPHYFSLPLNEQLIQFLVRHKCSISEQMMHRTQTSSFYIKATELRNHQLWFAVRRFMDKINIL